MLVLTSILLILASVSVVEPYRLPELYSPSSYSISLNVPLETFTNASNAYTGQVSIQLSFTNATNSIALHASYSFIQIGSVVFNNTEVASGNYSIDNTTDILTVNITEDIILDETYTLTINYTGRLSTTDMYGFYKSYYVDANGTTRYLATTQFEATHARRAFPCFDEPALKATFDFSITVPNGLDVLFNTPQLSNVSNATTGLTSIVFNTTPVMSTYLFAVIISDFTCTANSTNGTVPYQVCSRNESSPTRELAVEVGPQVVERLNNFTNYDYTRAMSKIDQVAIPDFAAGAMENWGLITYRETALLWDPVESSSRYRQRVVTVIAHELAHQWFGNLVTMKWWSEIFLNEGFATYFEFAIPNEIFPSWELNKQFVIEELHAALLADSLQNTHALKSNCTTPAEISSKFSTVSYSKGGAVLRMVEHFMQLENFKSGVQNYLVTYQYGNTVPEDLWSSLNQNVTQSSSLPANLTTIMENWVNLPGYPVVTAVLTGDQVTITQKRFLLSGQVGVGEWYVPISYTTSADLNKFQNTTPNLWLTPSTNLTLTLSATTQWIILNNQQSGYYRVNYCSTLWSRIKDALTRTDFDGISDLNRAHIVDDLFNLARAGQVTYPTVLDTISFLSNDTSYYPWYSALSGFSFLIKRVGESSLLGQTLSSNLLRLLTKLVQAVPISTINEEDIIYSHSQTLALSWACKLGHAACVSESKHLFSQYQSSGVRPNKNLRGIVYCNALRYSINSTADWEFLWNAYLNASGLATEQITILSALGCTRDLSLLNAYLNKTLTDGSGIRPQDSTSVLQSVYLGSPEGIDVAFEFLMREYLAISTKYSGWNALGSIIRGLAETFTTPEQITRLKNFIQSENLPEPFRVAANEAVEIAETNARWLGSYQGDLLTYYGIATVSSASEISASIALCIAILFVLFNV